jgi:hypothetical protein
VKQYRKVSGVAMAATGSMEFHTEKRRNSKEYENEDISGELTMVFKDQVALS